MSKADEMFEKLGYKKIFDNKRRIFYSNHFEQIIFELRDKCVDTGYFPLNMQELQAINEKCKELGWF